MQSYGVKVAEAILGRYCRDYIVVKENGVWPIYEDLDILQWKPACELEGPDAPDPFDAPSLPIPFNANDLAAFMVAGVGGLASSAYGDWNTGPDEEVLQSMGTLANKAREALRGAYAAYRDAEKIVGPLDMKIQSQSQQLASEYDQANDEANLRENIRERGITSEEYRLRRARAKDSIIELSKKLNESNLSSSTENEKWVKAMVNQLLRDDVKYGSQVPQKTLLMMDEFEQRPVIECKNSESYQSLAELIEKYADGTFEKMPEAIRDSVTMGFFPMPHWDELTPSQRRSMAQQHDIQHDPEMALENEYWFVLTCKICETESEIKRWERMSDQGIPTEAMIKKNELKTLRLRLKGLTGLFKLQAFTVQNWEQLTDDELTALSEGIPSVCVQTLTPNNRVVIANTALMPVQRFAAQDKAILLELKNLGYDPQKLPKNPDGKPGVKAAVRTGLSKNRLFVGTTVFDKAWERLTAGSEIVIR